MSACDRLDILVNESHCRGWALPIGVHFEPEELGREAGRAPGLQWHPQGIQHTTSAGRLPCTSCIRRRSTLRGSAPREVQGRKSLRDGLRALLEWSVRTQKAFEIEEMAGVLSNATGVDVRHLGPLDGSTTCITDEPTFHELTGPIDSLRRRI